MYIKKHYYGGLSVLLFSLFILFGCTQLDQFIAEHNLKTYQQVEDKYIVDAFYELSPDGRTEKLKPQLENAGFAYPNLTTSSLCFERKEYDEPNMGAIFYDIKGYNYDSIDDVVAVTYINAVKQRGNIIKIYKPPMGRFLARIFPLPFNPNAPRTATWYDLDNVLIEYNLAGEPISCLVRYHHAITSIGVREYQHVCIYFGKYYMRNLENKIPNSVFYEYFLREIK